MAQQKIFKRHNEKSLNGTIKMRNYFDYQIKRIIFVAKEKNEIKRGAKCIGLELPIIC